MKNIGLFFAAILLVLFLIPLGLITKAFYWIKKGRFDSGWFMRLALSLDQFGNVFSDDFLNLALIKKNEPSGFGDVDETISSVLGKNYQMGNLTILGELLRRVLAWFDPNHSVNAIER